MQYLIAKYVPCLERMEPKNIGVILWTPEKSIAKFLGEDPEGTTDIPSYVWDRREWKHYTTTWRNIAEKNHATFDEFVAAMGKGDGLYYTLVPGEKEGGTDVSADAASLFFDLVSPDPIDCTKDLINKLGCASDLCHILMQRTYLTDSGSFTLMNLQHEVEKAGNKLEKNIAELILSIRVESAVRSHMDERYYIGRKNDLTLANIDKLRVWNHYHNAADAADAKNKEECRQKVAKEVYEFQEWFVYSLSLIHI